MSSHFISFGSSRYARSLLRIATQAKGSGFFNTVTGYNESHISERNKSWILQNPRGYGFWIWKLELILRRLNEIPDDDILVYCDAGCTVNYRGSKRWFEYRNLIAPSTDRDILLFQMGGGYQDMYWTKRTAAEALKASPEALASGQLIGTILIMRKTTRLIDSLSQLWEFESNNRHILDDTVCDEHPQFRAHRHDQSALSVWIKSHYNNAAIIPDETYPPFSPPNWSLCCHVPFQATRHRNR